MSKRKKTSGKRKRSVRCTICTSYRWMGNSKGRFAPKTEMEKRDVKRLSEHEVRDSE